jgi:hypothetical protein
VEGGGWKVEGGRWRVEGGGWRVEGGRWRVEGEGVRGRGELPLHTATPSKSREDSLPSFSVTTVHCTMLGAKRLNCKELVKEIIKIKFKLISEEPIIEPKIVPVVHDRSRFSKKGILPFRPRLEKKPG